MRLVLIVIGRLKSGPERDLCERYAERFQGIGRSVGLPDLKIVELPESQARRPDDRMADEARAIEAIIPDGARRLLLDERGKSMNSEDFAGWIRKQGEHGHACLALIIGGPDGLDPGLRHKADLVLSFGNLTIPHQIVRALVFEQLYRAATILAGHPYHRI